MTAVRIGRGSRELLCGPWSKLSSSSATSSSARWFGIGAQPVPQDKEKEEDLVISDVRIFRFVAELGRELFIAAVDVADVAGKNRIIGALINRERETEHFPQAGVENVQ